jgi:DNA polymerase III subunit gamma/tau
MGRLPEFACVGESKRANIVPDCETVAKKRKHSSWIPKSRITIILYLAAMENFVVSARKYRPSNFNSVVGQQHITTTLKNAIKNNHLAQAFLFCGPRGVGKTTCARILAKTINCQNRTADFEACNTCDSCTAFNNNASFNVHELDAASNNSVDDIRNLVEQVRYAPQHGLFKVYIIDEVHMLSNAAFNAFLKTLEEPPKYAIFILATTEKHKVIPTILSRCQIFDFNRIQIKDIADHLKHIAKQEKIEAEEEALRLIATKADGALRDALSIFDLIVTYSASNKLTYQETINNLHILDYDYYFKVLDAVLAGNIGQVLLTFDEILKKGFDGHNFIVGLSEHLRDLMVCKDPETVSLIQVSESARARYLQQSEQTSVSFLLSALNICNQCDINYKSSRNQRLHVELALMKLSKLPQAISLAALAQDDSKKKV